MKTIDSRLQAAFLDAASIRHWNSPYAVTLTMKQAIRRGGFTVRIDHLKASQNLRHFLKLLNAKLFSSGDLRRGYRVRCIPVLENEGRQHYHLCLDKPADIAESLFMDLIFLCWWATDFGYLEVDVKPADFGWVRYMSKARSKTSFADAIDWANFHNPL